MMDEELRNMLNIRVLREQMEGCESILKIGCKGEDVMYLQQYLIARKFLPYQNEKGNSNADGIYGKRTAAAVTELQKKLGQTPDGVFGEKTLTTVEETPEVQGTVSHQPQKTGKKHGKALIIGDSQGSRASSGGPLSSLLGRAGYKVANNSAYGTYTAQAVGQIPGVDYDIVVLFTGGHQKSSASDATPIIKKFPSSTKIVIAGPPPAHEIRDLNGAFRKFPYLKKAPEGQASTYFTKPTEQRGKSMAKGRERRNSDFKNTFSDYASNVVYVDPRDVFGATWPNFPSVEKSDGIHLYGEVAEKMAQAVAGAALGKASSASGSSEEKHHVRSTLPKVKIREVDEISRRHGRIPRGKLPEIVRAIQDAASTHDVDEDILMGVVQMESGFNPYAKSPTGARGLFQFIGSTGRAYGLRSEKDFYDARKNADAGARLYKKNLEAAAKVSGGSVTPETEFYAYVAHNQGRGGLRQIVRSARSGGQKMPDKNVLRNMRTQGSRVKSAMKNNPSNPAQGFLDFFEKKWKSVKPRGMSVAQSATSEKRAVV